MAQNTLTNLIGPLYRSLDIVSQEMVGMIPCVTLDTNAERAAIGQVLYSFETNPSQATDIVPGMLPPDDGEQTIDSNEFRITKSRRVPFRWNGEQEQALRSSGTAPAAIQADQMTQAIRTLVNEMETDMWLAARRACSRAYGTAGSTPFNPAGAGIADSAYIRQILDDNGAPGGERALVINSTAGVNLRSIPNLIKANEAGTTLTLRSGELLDLNGLSFHESLAPKSIAKGTAASYTTNTAGYAVGSRAITLITGTGTILAGDVVTFAGDPNKYVAAKDLGTDGAGVLTLNKPGLVQAIAASAVAVTVGANATANIAFHKSSMLLATRAPALPSGGDSAVDRMLITDPRSGITFEVAMYAQYRQMQYEVSAAWGTGGIKAAHAAQLLG
jgi:hypothetical protein